jgi:hypothetical protein
MKSSIVKVHAAAASLALLFIICFFSSTLLSELFGSQQQIAAVKNSIFYAVWFLIPLMAATGITGSKLAGKAKSGLIGKKMKRMPFIALNGLLILVPSAVYLRSLAVVGDFSTVFYVVQVIELLAGAINITLMSLNFRDGMRVSKIKINNKLRIKK